MATTTRNGQVSDPLAAALDGARRGSTGSTLDKKAERAAKIARGRTKLAKLAPEKLARASRYIQDKCRNAFDNPKAYEYTRKADGKVVSGTSQIVLGRDMAATLQQIDAGFSDEETRMALYEAMVEKGLVKKAYAGKMGAALADNRYTSAPSGGGMDEFDKKFLASLK